MGIELKKLQANDEKVWNAYVHSHKHGTPFHLTNWCDAINTAFRHKSYNWFATRNKEICGILPLTHVKSFLFGNVLSSPGFAAYGGALADDDTVADALLFKAAEEAKRLSVDYVELKWKEDPCNDLPANDLYVTFVKELSSDHDENMKEIPRKQRAMVRKGIKSGLKVLVGNEFLDQFYDIFAINVHRLGTPVYGKKWFAALLDAYGDDAEIQVIQYEGKIISGVFSFYYGDTVLPYYAASLVEYRKYAPNDFQYWELMKRSVDKGCKYFDYGRSKKGTGQFSFKKHWGFDPQQLHYRYILNKVSEVPEVNPLNPKYQRKIELWKRLPLALTKIIGPPPCEEYSMNILFLAHRIPYPPNKGDKIRSFHQLKYLVERGTVYLGTLIDDSRDTQYEGELRKICSEVHVARITSKTRKLYSVLGHFKGKPASVCHFYEKSLQQWVDNILISHKIELIFCFSSTMAEYLFCSSEWKMLQQGNVKLLMDYCDVDSQKWLDYAKIKKWPFSGFFAREGKLLLEYEQKIADTFDSCFLASSREKKLFDEKHQTRNVEILENGVDLDFFSNHKNCKSHLLHVPVLVFTGAMDYDVNIDGVCWFVKKIWPKIIQAVPEVQFYIVGSNPTAEIKSLGRQDNIIVTGYVDDIREFYNMATICVAPLQIARGIQNKVLEALAMSKAVVCTSNAFEGITAEADEDLLVLNEPEEFAAGVVALLGDSERRQEMGLNGRSRMEKNYSWHSKMRILEHNLYENTAVPDNNCQD